MNVKLVYLGQSEIHQQGLSVPCMNTVMKKEQWLGCKLKRTSQNEIKVMKTDIKKEIIENLNFIK